MILSMKFWKKILRDNGQDIAGLMCIECFEHIDKFIGEHEAADLKNIKDNLFMECMTCKKLLGEDYTICDACGEIYPKKFDYRADEGKDCLPCHHGI